jgi:hypothetical protein
MTVHEYYKQARSLGAFRAVDCLMLARQAAALDEAKYVSVPPASVGVEVMPDGSAPVILSFGIKVF